MQGLMALPLVHFVLCVALVVGLSDLVRPWQALLVLFTTTVAMLAACIMAIPPKLEVMMASVLGAATPVELIDYSGDRHYTIARRIDDELLEASVEWHHDIGHVILRPDGTVDPKSPSFYVLFWLPLRAKDRMLHLLSNDLPDFSRLENMNQFERRDMMIASAKHHNLGW